MIEGDLLLIQEREGRFPANHARRVLEQTLVWTISSLEDLIEHGQAVAATQPVREETCEFVCLLPSEDWILAEQTLESAVEELRGLVEAHVVEEAASGKPHRSFAESRLNVLEVSLIVTHLARWMKDIADATANEDAHTFIDLRECYGIPLLQFHDHGLGRVALVVAGD